MLRTLFFLSACLFLPLFSFAQQLVITNVNVIPVGGGPMTLANQTVFIKDGKISEITPFQEEHMKLKARLIDGTGKYLIPGLADMHVHLPDDKSPLLLKKVFTLNLAAGVTTLRSMRGEQRHPGLRDSIRKKLILAPDLYISNPLPSDSAVTAAELKAFVAKSKKEGWDFVKYLSGLSPALFDSAVKYCGEQQLKLAGHVYNGDLQTALKAKQASVEHYQPILKEFRKDSTQFEKVIAQLKENSVFVCPTLSFYYIFGFQFSPEQLKRRNGMSYLDKTVQETWMKTYMDYYNSFDTPEKKTELQKGIGRSTKNLEDFGKLLKRMNDKKVQLLLSADDGEFNVPGFSLAEEMKLYKKAGLSNYEILKIATYNAACFFGAQKEWGSIGRGKKANLVLLDKDPLKDIENITAVKGVILGGDYYSQQELLAK
ncbi:MAG: amidohydrolase family protein [Bacteroidia bacterium]